MISWWKAKRKEVIKNETSDRVAKFSLNDYVKINTREFDPDNGKVALVQAVIFSEFSNHIRYDVKILDVDTEWEYDESELEPADCWDIFVYSNRYLTKMEENKMKKFTKDDLKVGMLVVNRGGKSFIIVENGNGDKYMTGKNEYHNLDQYSDDLLLIPGEECTSDIMKVYSKAKCIYSLDNLLDVKTCTYGILSTLPNRDLVWERKEVKEMTVAEISKALGYEVKIVK